MRKISKTALMAAAVAATGIFAGGAQAQQTWNVTEGTFNWAFDGNWTPGPYPNAVGAVANVNNDIVGEMNIVMPGGDGATVGILNLGDSGTAPDSKFTLGTLPGGQGTLVFDNGANDAQLNVLKDVTPGSITEFDQLGTNLTLNSNLAIDTGPIFASSVQIRGKISDGVNGPKGLIVNGTGFVELRQAGEANTFSGLTIVNSRLRLMSGGGVDLIAGDIQIQNGGVVQDGFGNGNCISDTSNINVIDGRYNPGGASDTIGSLEGGDAGQAGGGGGTVTFGANNLDKTYNGIFFSETSWVKTGTGVQTLGGPNASVVSDGSPVGQQFGVLGGRVDLAKPNGITSIGQRNLNIGDGSQAGALRPELRLLANEQIQVHLSAGSTETTPVTLNSGVLNLNGFSETVGSLIVAGAGTSTIQRASGLSMVNGLTVNDTATLEAASDGTFNNVIKTPSLTIGATAHVDLKDNKLVVAGGDVGSWNGSEYTGVTGLVQDGRGTGTWNGASGIVTSMSDATGGVLTTLAVALAEDVGYAGGTFGGVSVSAGDVLVMYTWGGDAQMDGDLDGDDYFQIDSNVAQSGSVFGFDNGDFNYDGLINGDDYFIIDSNIAFAQSQPAFPTGVGAAGLAAVPEPGGVLVALLGMSALRRKRRAERP